MQMLPTKVKHNSSVIQCQSHLSVQEANYVELGLSHRMVCQTCGTHASYSRNLQLIKITFTFTAQEDLSGRIK